MKKIIPMDYYAAENISASEVYNKLLPFYQKRSIGQLVANMHHIDTRLLKDGSLRVQGYIDTSKFLEVMQGDAVEMYFRLNGDKTEIWCCIVYPFCFKKIN